MTERTEELIQRLARGLQPVRRLPGLGRVAASIACLTLALVAAQIVPAWLRTTPWPKPDFGAVDAGTIAAHALLFAGALAFALGACVPGRERLSRIGALPVALSLAAIAWLCGARLDHWPGVAALAPGWLGATVSCSLEAIVPAALPALLFARFASRAAPRHALLVLLLGAVAPIGLLTQPGVLGCAYPDELHQTVAHLLTPAFGGLLLLVVAAPAFFTLRRSERV